jgi:hypothetical protein
MSHFGSPVEPIDHVVAALSRLKQQFKDRPKIEAMLTALVAEVQPLESALQQLYHERAIDTAIGAQLDVLGAIVGQPRGGLSDELYRRYIRTKISVNQSDSLVENVIRVMNLFVNDDAASYEVDEQYPAGIAARVHGRILTEAESDGLIRFLRDTVAAGVRILLEYLTALEADTFSTAIFTPLNGAHLAGVTTLNVDDTSEFPDTGSLDLDVGLAVEETKAYTAKTATTFTVAATSNAHADNAAVQLSGSPGKGWGDSVDGSIGGKMSSVKE